MEMFIKNTKNGLKSVRRKADRGQGSIGNRLRDLRTDHGTVCVEGYEYDCCHQAENEKREQMGIKSIFW